MPKRPPRAHAELPIPDDLEGPLSPKTLAFTSELGQLWRSDVFELLAEFEDGSVDLVVTDPPYAIGKDRWDVFESLEHYVEWCDSWLLEVSRVLSPSGSAYVCGFSEILAEVKARSAKHFSACRWLVWFYKNKANLGSDWGRSHESIIHLRKAAKTKLNVDEVRVPYNTHTKRYPARVQAVTSQYGGKGKRRDKWQPHPLGAKPRDVFEIPVLCNGTAERNEHPTQKPEELIRRMIAASSGPGDLVVDPFGGSGTTAAIAEKLGRRWVVGDADARYVGLTRRRLSAE
ncbi:MAG: site-specific DNA-methyltransferase [Myxococcales bacterium]|nr:site-specific DNA-methyltransferase [Myxococcales bacterium]